jgi:hypothetical protein
MPQQLVAVASAAFLWMAMIMAMSGRVQKQVLDALLEAADLGWPHRAATHCSAK